MIITLNEGLTERRGGGGGNFIKTNEFVFFFFLEKTTRDKQSFFQPREASERVLYLDRGVSRDNRASWPFPLCSVIKR